MSTRERLEQAREQPWLRQKRHEPTDPNRPTDRPTGRTPPALPEVVQPVPTTPNACRQCLTAMIIFSR